MIVSHLTAARLTSHSYWSYTFQNKKTDVQVYCQDVHGVRYIVFPGTHTLKDFITNFRVNQAITPYVDKGYKGKSKLHQGYYEAYRSVQYRVLELCSEREDVELAFAGHSAGGAIAQIAAVDCQYKLGKRIEVVTFGAPATGNIHWRNSAGEMIVNTSYVNPFDVVPHMIFWLEHVTDLVMLPNIYLDPHHIKNYVDTIKKPWQIPAQYEKFNKKQ